MKNHVKSSFFLCICLLQVLPLIAGGRDQVGEIWQSKIAKSPLEVRVVDASGEAIPVSITRVTPITVAFERFEDVEAFDLKAAQKAPEGQAVRVFAESLFAEYSKRICVGGTAGSRPVAIKCAIKASSEEVLVTVEFFRTFKKTSITVTGYGENIDLVRACLAMARKVLARDKALDWGLLVRGAAYGTGFATCLGAWKSWRSRRTEPLHQAPQPLGHAAVVGAQPTGILAPPGGGNRRLIATVGPLAQEVWYSIEQPQYGTRRVPKITHSRNLPPPAASGPWVGSERGNRTRRVDVEDDVDLETEDGLPLRKAGRVAQEFGHFCRPCFSVDEINDRVIEGHAHNFPEVSGFERVFLHESEWVYESWFVMGTGMTSLVPLREGLTLREMAEGFQPLNVFRMLDALVLGPTRCPSHVLRSMLIFDVEDLDTRGIITDHLGAQQTTTLFDELLHPEIEEAVERFNAKIFILGDEGQEGLIATRLEQLHQRYPGRVYYVEALGDEGRFPYANAIEGNFLFRIYTLARE